MALRAMTTWYKGNVKMCKYDKMQIVVEDFCLSTIVENQILQMALTRKQLFELKNYKK